MKKLIIALLTPLSPPKNYCFSERNFEDEYQQMKSAYEKRQTKKPQCAALINQKFEYTFVR
ncbi:MAG TPA: hypothetical protein V6C76_12290 [Drouetiella sp.]